MNIFNIILFIWISITFINPLIQSFIGFNYIVKDGESPNIECSLAPDLPLLMAIGGIFSLFFLGAAYGLLKMLSSTDNPHSDVAGTIPKFIVGFTSFIFGTIKLIFFTLIQIRMYELYSKDSRYSIQPVSNYCHSKIVQSAFTFIILHYINFVLFVCIYAIVLVRAYNKRREKYSKEFEITHTLDNIRF